MKLFFIKSLVILLMAFNPINTEVVKRLKINDHLRVATYNVRIDSLLLFISLSIQ